MSGVIPLEQGYIVSNKNFLHWVDNLTESFDLIGPRLSRKDQTIFGDIESSGDLHWGYCSTMLAPRKFLYPARQDLLRFDGATDRWETLFPPDSGHKIIMGIHACDMFAISVLDRTFLGETQDFYYRKLREEMATVVLNCNQACDKGFCASMGTGPFLQLSGGYDLEMTDLGGEYLVEWGSERGRALIERSSRIKPANAAALRKKNDLEERARKTFTKHLGTLYLPELLMRNLDHPVYRETAQSRCLGCTNCTMVCPTCYCYNMEDVSSFDLATTVRRRYWDSCQELHFAQVHGGNFRSSREARLRQFVIHKLATWVEQYGCFGCVGCGRCMTWCPTSIDLTEMAQTIQHDYERGKAR